PIDVQFASGALLVEQWLQLGFREAAKTGAAKPRASQARAASSTAANAISDRGTDAEPDNEADTEGDHRDHGESRGIVRLQRIAEREGITIETLRPHGIAEQEVGLQEAELRRRVAARPHVQQSVAVVPHTVPAVEEERGCAVRRSPIEIAIRSINGAIDHLSRFIHAHDDIAHGVAERGRENARRIFGAEESGSMYVSRARLTTGVIACH